jgi:site-specific recombinase XerD
VRPYTLRHTFSIDHLTGGTDIGDLQGLLGHHRLETTRKFYAPVLRSRLKKASKRRRLKLADRLPAADCQPRHLETM